MKSGWIWKTFEIRETDYKECIIHTVHRTNLIKTQLNQNRQDSTVGIFTWRQKLKVFWKCGLKVRVGNGMGFKLWQENKSFSSRQSSHASQGSQLTAYLMGNLFVRRMRRKFCQSDPSCFAHASNPFPSLNWVYWNKNNRRINLTIGWGLSATWTWRLIIWQIPINLINIWQIGICWQLIKLVFVGIW